MHIARILLAILALTSFAHARGFMMGVGSGGGLTTFLTLSGPSSGLVSTPSTNFTVTFTGGTFNGTTNTVTLTAAPPGGTFTPASPITPAAGASFTFTYTPPATPGTYVITMTNNIGVANLGTPFNYNAVSSLSAAYPLVIP